MHSMTTKRIPAVRVRLLFEKRDLWVGVYWDTIRGHYGTTWMVYICILPLLPIKFSWYVGKRASRLK